MLIVYTAWIVGLICTWLLWRKLRSILRERRRAQLYAMPLPDASRALLQKHVAIYRQLPVELRDKLHGHINFFLHDKKFVGRNGLEISDEIRLTIAGNACLLVLAREARIYPHFKTILVYPDTYVAKQVSYDGAVQIHQHSTRLGESWHRGPIVLSWADVLRGSIDGSDGHNVVIHEFAHKLDEENTSTNGTPILRESTHYKQWIEVLNKEYSEFLTRVAKRKNKVIDEYGAVSPPEFFAVASESFFEKSQSMLEKLPDLYEQLSRYYGVDPARWP